MSAFLHVLNVRRRVLDEPFSVTQVRAQTHGPRLEDGSFRAANKYGAAAAIARRSHRSFRRGRARRYADLCEPVRQLVEIPTEVRRVRTGLIPMARYRDHVKGRADVDTGRTRIDGRQRSL
jgi:hypothetical protein